MKLFVYCPAEYYEKYDSEEWVLANNLSKKSKLPIVTHIDGFDSISIPQIVSLPEKKYYDIDKTVKSGFIHKIDITDEFHEMGKNIIARYTDPDGFVYDKLPIVKEKYKVKFRDRHQKKGLYKIVIIDNGINYIEDQFEVV